MFKLYKRRVTTIQAVQITEANKDSLIAELNGDLAQWNRRLQLFDKIHSTWIKIEIGDWIAKGPLGEYYPIKAAAFPELYFLYADGVPPPSFPGMFTADGAGGVDDRVGKKWKTSLRGVPYVDGQEHE